MRILLLIFFLQLSIELSEGEVFLWPQPRFIRWGKGPSIPISSSFQISTSTPSHRELHHATLRYTDLVLNERWVPFQVPLQTHTNTNNTNPNTNNTNTNATVPVPLARLHITVADPAADLQHGVDESYLLTVPDRGGLASLSSQTAWGALRGLETFSQLVRSNLSSSSSSSSLLNQPPFIEHGVIVRDWPSFAYRGLLLDTARNFYPVPDILRTLDAMSFNKLNVFHWHVTDSQSFPIHVPSRPELAEKGSYGPKFIYSPSDVRKIVRFARQRGIRVVPEFDTPGHSASWGAAYPDIVTCKDEFWYDSSLDWSMRMASEPTPGQLNPLHPETYQVLENVTSDMATLFPDRFYHGGCDEIAPACWNKSADIAQYLADGGTLNTLLERFVSSAHAFIRAKGKTAVFWEDVLLNEAVNVSITALPRESTILETWNEGPANTKAITGMGYRVIVASADFYYLDCGRGAFVGNEVKVDVQVNPTPGTPSYNYGGSGGSWCAPYKSWQRIYAYDITYNLTEVEAALVLGGEVSLWSEQSDATTMDALLWPRASALAESLWSGNRGPDGKKRLKEAINRLNDWRYRLVSRGIAAAPLQPLWCLRNPSQCDN